MNPAPLNVPVGFRTMWLSSSVAVNIIMCNIWLFTISLTIDNKITDISVYYYDFIIIIIINIYTLPRIFFHQQKRLAGTKAWLKEA